MGATNNIWNKTTLCIVQPIINWQNGIVALIAKFTRFVIGIGKQVSILSLEDFKLVLEKNYS